MPLLKCPDCGKEFSDSAATCPNCGRPNKPAKKPLGCFGIGCLAIVVLAVIAEIVGSSSSTSTTPPSTNSSSYSAPVAVAGPQLELESWTWHTEYGYAIAEGIVKNISSAPLRSVQAVVTFRTKSGEFITAEDALIDLNPVLPGQSSPFKVMATENPAMHSASVDFKEFFGGTIPWREKARRK